MHDLAGDRRCDDHDTDDTGDRVVAHATTDLSLMPRAAGGMDTSAFRLSTSLCVLGSACGHALFPLTTSAVDVA